MRTRVLPSLSAIALATAFLGAPAHGQFANPPVAVDVNPDPTIVEIFLEASETTKQYVPGAATAVAASNGTIPGPTIEANVGDTLIVHFTNNLDIDTTVHWHGVETPANMDGSHIAQLPIPPGGTFDYEFELLTPSLFWYHPHIRTNEMVEKGLYGALLVNDPVGEAGLGLPAKERILILDDIRLDANNQIDTHDPADPLLKVADTLNGRDGNHVLVNGTVAPVSMASVVNGVPERWRLVNVANVKFFRLSWEDDNALVYRIGGDGGLLETPQLKPKIFVDTEPADGGSADHLSSGDPNEGVMLVNGERADVVWTPHSPTMGSDISVRSLRRAT